MSHSFAKKLSKNLEHTVLVNKSTMEKINTKAGSILNPSTAGTFYVVSTK